MNKFKVGDTAVINPKWPSENAGYRGTVVIIRQVLPNKQYLCESKHGVGFGAWEEKELAPVK